MILVRTVAQADTRAMADLLKEIIPAGDRSAGSTAISRQSLDRWVSSDPARSAWHKAEDAAGMLLGFQVIAPKDGLPPDACEIASFVRTGRASLPVGSRLFEATAIAARHLGYSWINATIRSDNTGALVYYQSRGFEDYRVDRDRPPDKGSRVMKISKCYTL